VALKPLLGRLAAGVALQYQLGNTSIKLTNLRMGDE
jgi:hypothetical protein